MFGIKSDNIHKNIKLNINARYAICMTGNLNYTKPVTK